MYNGKQWKKCRAYIFKKYNGLCADCGKPGEEVHHITFLTPKNITDPYIVYGEDNLVLLCKECHHNRHKKAEKRKYYFDENGEIHQRLSETAETPE